MLTTSHIERVLSFYDLGKPRHVTQPLHGNMNETAFVQTDQGRFVVRRNHRRLGEEAQRYRHKLTAWLRDRGFCAPPLVPTRTGTTLLRLDGYLHEVHVFVEGQDYNPARLRQLTSIGATLAHYHQAVQGFALPPGPPPEPRYSPRVIFNLSERLVECDVMGDLCTPLAWYDARALHLGKALPDYAYLPHGVIHGDMHSGNLRFRGDSVVALLDYDQVVWDARIVDLVDALVSFATTTAPADQMMWGVFRGPLDLERASRLVAGYVSVLPLDPAEIEALPAVIELSWLQGELGRVASTLEGSPEYHLEVLDQGQRLSNWMRRHEDQLVRDWSALNDAVALPLAA